jgi:hypothetical protein
VILLLNKTIPKQGVTVLQMKGSIHSGPDCRRVEQEVEQLIGANNRFVILDLAEVTHIDSAAIGSIVRRKTLPRRLCRHDRGQHQAHKAGQGSRNVPDRRGCRRKMPVGKLTALF